MSAPEVVQAVARCLGYVATVLACGGLIGPVLQRPASRLARVGRGATIVAMALLLATKPTELVAQAAWTFAEDGPLQARHLAVIISNTSWGTGWVLQMTAVMALTIVVLARRGPIAIGFATLAMVAAQPLTGHAAQGGFNLLAWLWQVLHIGAAATWVGTLAVLACYTLEVRVDGAELGRATAAWQRFSPMAMVCVAALSAAGVASALQLLPEPTRPWASEYGRLLIAKVTVAAAVGAAGAFNWRRVLPKLPEANATRALLTACALELSLALLVLGLTAVLVASSPG